MTASEQIEFWTRRRRELARKIAQAMDRGQAPRLETIQAYNGVGSLLQELVLGTPTADLG